jgi:assimilatory nitrate reductase catalytic subunit
LVAALFLSKSVALPTRDWLIEQLGLDTGAAVLAGRPSGHQVDRGAIVCACFNIGINTIVSAIADHGLVDVASIGAVLGAGTNCGSCRPALAGLLASAAKEVTHA